MKNLVNPPSQSVSRESAPLKLAATHFLRLLCLLVLSSIFPVVPRGWLATSTPHHSQFKDTVTLQRCCLEPPRCVLAVGKAVTISPDYVNHQIVNFNLYLRLLVVDIELATQRIGLSRPNSDAQAVRGPTFGHDSFARMDP